MGTRKVSSLKAYYEKKYRLEPGMQRIGMRPSRRNISPGSLPLRVKYILRKDRGNELSAPVPLDEKGRVIEDPYSLASTMEASMPVNARYWLISLSPERGGELDLRQYLARVLDRFRAETGRYLHVIAAEHKNTHHPHLHLIVPEIPDRSGKPVRLLSREMFTVLRWCASKEATLHLGRESLLMQMDIGKLISMPYWTAIDDRILERLRPDRTFCVEPAKNSYTRNERHERRLVLARLGWLKKKGLARKTGKNFRLFEDWMEKLVIPEKRMDRFREIRFGMEDGTVQSGSDVLGTKFVDLTRLAFSPLDVAENMELKEQMGRIQKPFLETGRLAGVTIADSGSASSRFSRQVLLIQTGENLLAYDAGSFEPGLVRHLVRNLGRNVALRERSGERTIEPVLGSETEKSIDLSRIPSNIDSQKRILFFWNREEELERQKKIALDPEHRQHATGMEHRIREAAHVIGIVLPPAQPLHFALELALER
ncbi:putative/UNKNOWN PROTEIN [Leptospirillum ferriphilum]|jgi:hypothetical protein|uniref:Uncharacterized protein n=1 Tax=Leptospirillum ferriphilum TaxID=178606 RepID=A0A094X5C0_9BACT|nr:hypothetical protein [Leptospirillum ferriphilum]KGA93754.1 putative/UNKNOWN PROTEIN [Leptospirillum ferriphilum]